MKKLIGILLISQVSRAINRYLAYSSDKHVTDALKYLQKSLDMQHEDSTVVLLCSILLAIDESEQVLPVLETALERQPKNPKSLRLYLDYCMFYRNGKEGLELNIGTPEWLDAAEKLLKIDPTCDYALSLLARFNSSHEGLFTTLLPIESVKVIELIANRLEYPAGELKLHDKVQNGDVFLSVSSTWLWTKLVEHLAIQRRSTENSFADSKVWNYRASYWWRLFFTRPLVSIGDEETRDIALLMAVSIR
jgi:hypothetical protein